MKKALFFDIDGTLLSFKTHAVPKSTFDALSAAKQRGHKLFIATGRPPMIINSVGELLNLFDGFVTTNGAYCFAGKNVICHHIIDKEMVKMFVDDAITHHYSCILVSDKDMAVICPTPIVHEIFELQLNIRTLNYTMPIEDILSQDILQITSFFDAEYEKHLPLCNGKCNIGRWHPAFIDITAPNIDKGEGILAVAEHFGISKEDTIAFGDGGNDAPMLMAAGIGVAMGNASDETKAVADYVTTHIDDNGIFNALNHLNVI